MIPNSRVKTCCGSCSRSFPLGKLLFALDRTNWQHGQTDLNLLVLGVVVSGVTLPLVWVALPHGGNSDSAARMRLVARLLQHLPARRWKALVADREFIGQAWFTFLRERRIPRCIRLRENTRLDDDFVRDAFQKLERGQVRGLFERAWVYGSPMQVVATLSPEGERVIVASDLSIPATLEVYRQRWCIECTFSALKARGLGLEETHMVKAARIERLFGLLTLALVWMVRVGVWREETRPIPLKKHGRKAVGVAQYGWDLLADALRWSARALQTYLHLLTLPFPAPGAARTQVVRY